jgi:hypothetical protein
MKTVEVAERSEAWTVFYRSEAVIAGSNPAWTWMFNVCPRSSLFVVLCLGRGLAMSWSPVQGALQSVKDQETEYWALCSNMAGSSRLRGKEEEKIQMKGGRDSAVGIATRPRGRSSNLGRGKTFLLSKPPSRALIHSLPSHECQGPLPQRYSGWGVMLTTHFQLVPTSSIRFTL